MELRKAFAYRVAFWVNFILGIISELMVAYFLWRAVFEARGVIALEGFTFRGILFYYVIGATAQRIVRASGEGIIAQEIYDGSLTRYLLYPLPFLGYKYVATVAQQTLGFLQLALCLGLAVSIMGLPVDQNISATSILMGSVATVVAGYLYFSVSVMLEMVAFWQDTIWNLLAMFRFMSSLLGGLTVPIVFFPQWAQKALALSPFPYLFSFPIKSFLGQVSLSQWMLQIMILGSWSLLFTWMYSSVWKNGTKHYNGVGI